jgi:hypothetical protein
MRGERHVDVNIKQHAYRLTDEATLRPSWKNLGVYLCGAVRHANHSFALVLGYSANEAKRLMSSQTPPDESTPGIVKTCYTEYNDPRIW